MRLTNHQSLEIPSRSEREGESRGYSLDQSVQISNASSCDVQQRSNQTREERVTHLPGEEGGLFNDGRLHNLLPWKHTPCDSIHRIRCCIRPELALIDQSPDQHTRTRTYLLIGRINTYGSILGSLQALFQLLDYVCRRKEFDKRLLENVSSWWAPAVHEIFRIGSVDCRLRAYRPVLQGWRIKSKKLRKNCG